MMPDLILGRMKVDAGGVVTAVACPLFARAQGFCRWRVVAYVPISRVWSPVPRLARCRRGSLGLWLRRKSLEVMLTEGEREPAEVTSCRYCSPGGGLLDRARARVRSGNRELIRLGWRGPTLSTQTSD
jgi:hypothetical protein